MNPTLIIILSGRAGAGKTHLAALLQVWYANSMRLSFAGPLKNLALSLGWNGEKDARGRKLLQLLGTDVYRDCIDQDHWVKRTIHTIQQNSEHSCWIIDDARYDNEIKLLREIETYHVIHIHVHRRRPWRQRLRELIRRPHISERGLTVKPDATIVNDGESDDYFYAALKAIGEAIPRIIYVRDLQNGTPTE